MQGSPVFINRPDENDLVEISGRFNEDFQMKLRVQREEDVERAQSQLVNEKSEPEVQEVDRNQDVHEEAQESEEEEFSFVLTNPDGSAVSSDQDFQIRPMYPLFNRDLLYDAEDEVSGTQTLRPPLKKIFVEEHDSDKSSEADEDASGSYCVWSGKAVDASPESCKKCNSTGFSKLWRFRELVLRSNSDGKDAFVFFNSHHHHHHHHPSSTTTTTASSSSTRRTRNVEKKENVEKTVKVKGKGKTAPSPHEQHYRRNKAMKEGDKHRSYLPYRVGLFTSVNGMSRNVHPF